MTFIQNFYSYFDMHKHRQNYGLSPIIKSFFIELRPGNPFLRQSEIYDCIQAYGASISKEFLTLEKPFLDIRNHDGKPIAGYIKLPSDDILLKIVSRSSCIRSAVEVWGDGCDIESGTKSCTLRTNNFTLPYVEYSFPLPT